MLTQGQERFRKEMCERLQCDMAAKPRKDPVGTRVKPETNKRIWSYPGTVGVFDGLSSTTIIVKGDVRDAALYIVEHMTAFNIVNDVTTTE